MYHCYDLAASASVENKYKHSLGLKNDSHASKEKIEDLLKQTFKKLK